MMFNPPHPGKIIREFCVDAIGLTVTEAASALSRHTIMLHWLFQMQNDNLCL